MATTRPMAIRDSTNRSFVMRLNRVTAMVSSGTVAITEADEEVSLTGFRGK